MRCRRGPRSLSWRAGRPAGPRPPCIRGHYAYRRSRRRKSRRVTSGSTASRLHSVSQNTIGEGRQVRRRGLQRTGPTRIVERSTIAGLSSRCDIRHGTNLKLTMVPLRVWGRAPHCIKSLEWVVVGNGVWGSHYCSARSRIFLGKIVDPQGLNLRIYGGTQ